MAARKKKKAPKRGKKKSRAKGSAAKTSTRSFARELISELNKGKEATPAQLLGGGGKAIPLRGAISTQCETLDDAIGRGGVPLGRTTVLHGKEGSGKTTLALHCVAEVQRRKGMAVYIDTEYKLDRNYAGSVGVDVDHLVVIQPPHLESAFRAMEVVIRIASGLRVGGDRVPVIIVLDSIDATKSKAVIEGNWDDQHYAPEPRVWSEKFPKLLPALSREDVALLLVSQIRDKIGVLFGKKDKTAGGHAPRFYCSLLMGVERIGSIKNDKDEVVGNNTRVYIGKNQIAPPFRSAEFNILYGHGIDYEDSLFRIALERGVIEQSGAWYSIGNERIGQGRENAVKTLRSSEVLVSQLRKAIA